MVESWQGSTRHICLSRTDCNLLTGKNRGEWGELMWRKRTLKLALFFLFSFYIMVSDGTAAAKVDTTCSGRCRA